MVEKDKVKEIADALVEYWESNPELKIEDMMELIEAILK